MGMIYTGQCCEGARKNDENLKWLDVKNEEFSIHGLYDFYNQKVFRRVPEDVAKNTSENVESLCTNTAGARVRFVTDSPVLSVRSHNYRDEHMYHTTMILDGGFDIFIRENGKQKFVAPIMSSGDRFDMNILRNHGKKGIMREIVLYLPTTGYIDKLEIGIEKDCNVQKAADYTISKPVVYYGSSITHGYCPSRSGNTYEAIISRQLDCDYINLGFSGSCKGEQAMADYIATLDMSAFVLDYDHNAANSEYLAKTHYNVFKTVREKNPTLPIILVSKPDFHLDSVDENLRRAIIMETYIRARRDGDINTHLVDGAALFGRYDKGECTIDGCHPTDLGHRLMAELIGRTLEDALKYREEQKI